jgi:hypothetical protein
MKRSYVGRSWQLSAALLITLATGCATRPERIARYIKKHPDRPAAISTALQRNRIEAGMTPKEVRLCLGPPNRIDKAGTKEQSSETWHYFKKRNKEHDRRSSSFWALDIPKATIYFSSDERVTEAAFYDGRKPSPPQKKVQSAAPQTAPRAAEATHETTRETPRETAREATHYVPSPDELGVKGFPRLALGGVLAMGSERSAILDSEVFAPGESTKGVTVVDVYANGVLLEYRGSRTFLRTGEMTE